jgi:hypothetical protein
MPKQRQKQSQKQSVKVVVNLAEQKKKRKRRAKKRPVDGMSQFQQLRQPQVIYYQQDTTGYLKPNLPPPSILSTPVRPPAFVNTTTNFGSLPEDAMDVGVGRRGIEEIVDMDELPLKPDKLGKQLAQQIKPPPQSMTEGLFEGQGDIEFPDIISTKSTEEEIQEFSPRSEGKPVGEEKIQKYLQVRNRIEELKSRGYNAEELAEMVASETSISKENILRIFSALPSSDITISKKQLIRMYIEIFGKSPPSSWNKEKLLNFIKKNS